jgi:hypothetical protein
MRLVPESFVDDPTNLEYAIFERLQLCMRLLPRPQESETKRERIAG